MNISALSTIIMLYFVVFILCIDTIVNGFENGTLCYNRFEYEYHVLEKLVKSEQDRTRLSGMLSNVYSRLSDKSKEIESLDSRINILETSLGVTAGSTYIRWGRTTCPNDTGSELVYKGLAAGPQHNHPGGGSNYLCLPEDPIFGENPTGGSRELLYGAEYETTGTFMSNLHNNDVPCAVCKTKSTNVLMIPARNVCYPGWKTEYSGYLMTSHYNHPSQKNYACMDADPKAISGGSANQNGALFYFVEGRCGSLKCPPYIEGHELTCVVCSLLP
ncbi:uncharacterized protein LOC128226119 [Mya arenaria]|uniref:uncharacterized protein LOC128226119 n=1 Tax=Mya arenaria TaxID=6604 RepID=UPI0022E8ECBB|nr:uncharacterized protein LOC128226119 [Mya arenaria]